MAVLQQLMKFDLQVVTTCRNRTSDSTPLHLAAEGGHVDVTRILLEAGASVLDEDKVLLLLLLFCLLRFFSVIFNFEL